MIIGRMKMFNIPNLLTACNMLCGVLAIMFAFSGRIDLAPWFLFLAAIFDFFDGFVARLLKQQGELGKQLDSLADMISFGLAPGIIMAVILIYGSNIGAIHDVFPPVGEYITVSWNQQLKSSFLLDLVVDLGEWKRSLFDLSKINFLPFAALLIPFFSMFRLAKFNIDTRQSESFIGLPTPANTIFFMSFPLLLSHYADTSGWEHDLILWIVQPAVLIPVILIMSLLLVAELPLFALKFKSFQWKGNEIRYGFLISCALLLVLIRFWAIPIIVILYLLLSVVNNYTSKQKHA